MSDVISAMKEASAQLQKEGEKDASAPPAEQDNKVYPFNDNDNDNDNDQYMF
jgi:hypothetical protein